MTCYLKDDATSVLKDGIETLLIPVRDPHDLERLQLETSRGGYAIAEWLLSAIDRWNDLSRVCGLSATPEPGRVVVTLELRQPGKQLEEWLRDHGECGRFNRLPNGDLIFSDSTGIETLPTLVLSRRSLDRTPFWDSVKPWWQANTVRDLEEEDTITP